MRRPIDDPLPDGAPVIYDPDREVPAVDPPRRDAPGPVRDPQGPRRDPSQEGFQPKESHPEGSQPEREEQP